MKVFKKTWLIIKIGFLSIFGTTRGLANVEKEIAFITGKDSEPTEKSKDAKT